MELKFINDIEIIVYIVGVRDVSSVPLGLRGLAEVCTSVPVTPLNIRRYCFQPV